MNKLNNRIPGLARLLFPALIVWVLAAVCIGIPNLAQKLALIISGLLCVIVVAVALFVGAMNAKKSNNAENNRSVKRFIQITAVTFGVVLLFLARIEYLENAQVLAEQKLGLAGIEEPQKRYINNIFYVTDFVTETSTATGNRFAVKAAFKHKAAHIRVILWVDDQKSAQWSPGTKIEIEGYAGKLDPASMYAYEISVKELNVLAENYSFVAKLRTNLRNAAADIKGANLVPGFAVGDTSLVNEKLDSEMKESSLTHLTAVSGANCALITGAVLVIAARLGVRRRMRFCLAAVILSGFVVVVGPDPSVQRAAIMSAVALLSGFGGKRAVAFPALGAAIFILLFLDPWQSRAPGFTLSVAATGGILLLVPTLEKAINLVVRMPRWATLPFTVTIAAQIACGPLLLLLQPGLPAAGVPANVLAAPAAPLGTGLGLLALVTLPINSQLGHLFVWAASFPARWVEATAQVSANLPYSRWYWPGGPLGATLLFIVEVVLACAFIYWQQKRILREPWKKRLPQPTKVVAITVTVATAGVGIFVATTFVTPLARYISTPKNWIVVACDVGQGDATLLRSLEDKTKVILIDTGDDEELLKECLYRFGVSEIELLVLTHDDKDHVGALPVVIDLVNHAMVSPPIFGVQHFEREIVQMLRYKQIPITVAYAQMQGGFNGGQQGGLTWDVLWPTHDALLLTDNASSIVLNVQSGSFRYLLLGDTGADEHQMMLLAEESLAADVVKIAHHGSGDFDERLLAVTGARHGIISSGLNNRYGHPHPKVLDTLESNGISQLRTDIYGSIAITQEDKNLSVWLETK
ncbi:MAG TPA: ComEC/Rec2 family competence protein [Microbacteriaceae bacterium]|nr:ComEC/Rec2 family competence protein [Microbacteriaceae bacterium]